ncbi:hypothetical protein [Streptomyces herbicida]|uniref:hypothetical protein n=1 Tax=Streptomyces herbicida TaxID=3065675 RepID=UPI002931B34B|nr:hypothetical protein [Streptomyces sp. NEAU-HV9]
MCQGTAEAHPAAGDLVVLAPGVRHRHAVPPGSRRRRFWWTHCQARPSWTAWLCRCTVGDGMHAVPAVVAVAHGSAAPILGCAAPRT